MPQTSMSIDNVLTLLLRGWVIVWILAVPLFHVHSETDHHHGETVHMHGGTVHTVFSADLDGEFGIHEADAKTVAGISYASSHTWEEPNEFGFSLLNDSNNRTLLKPFLIQVTFVASSITPILQFRTRAIPESFSTPSSTILVHDFPSRAPPASFV
jgi:hypothetical protein